MAVFVANLLGAGNAFAQITNIGSQSATTTTTALSIAKPTGLALGDVMFASIIQSNKDAGQTLAAPTLSGWTSITGANVGQSGNNTWRGDLFAKVVTASDVSAASFSATLSTAANGDGGAGAITAFRGVDVDDPFDATPGSLSASAASTTLTATTQTTADLNSAVILFGFTGASVTYSGWTTTNPGALNELYDFANGAAVLPNSLGAAWAIKSGTGATGTASVTISASARGDAAMVTLRQAKSITTNAISGSPFCPGSPVAVSFTAQGTYAANNTFTAQLSNASGSFTSPTAIGTLTNATTGSSINATIPAAQAAGTGYRIRVIASSPSVTGSNNGTNLTVTALTTAVAGTAVSMCESSGSANITAGSSSANATLVTWTSSGTGTVGNANSLTTATYSPSAADIAAGSVTLTLTANGTCNNPTSSKTLSISKTPTASAGGSATICQNQTHTVAGATASNGTIAWTENGAGSITSGANTLAPTYTPGAGDAGNTVTLTMTVSNSPCSAATATYTISVRGAATASAGSTLSTCENTGAVVIGTGATSTNNSGVQWSSSGTGTFTGATSLNSATYTPSQADINAGSVTLTLTAFGNSPCGNATSSKTLVINPIPVTTNATICQGGSGSLTSGTVCPAGGATQVLGPQAAGTGANLTGIGSAAWSSPSNITSAGSPYATVTTSVISASNYLYASNFGFAIPAGSIINGIQVAVNRQSSGSNSYDNEVRLVKGGTIVGDNKAIGIFSQTYPTTMGVANYGGTSDLWGTTWTLAEVNASGFGVAFATTSLASRTASVDYIRVTVTYTPPGQMRWYTVASGGTPVGTGLSFNPVGVANSGIPNNTTVGTFTFYAECSTVAGCRTPTTFTINALPTVSFTGLAATYCQNAASVVLTANHSGGTFSGAGITDNANGTATFNPATAGLGAHAISYSYIGGNSCPNTTSLSVTVLQNVTYYADADSDTFGNAAVTSISCTGAPVGFVSDNTDCDDANALAHTSFAFYADADHDGFGTGSLTAVCAVNANTPPTGFSINATDCNDADATMHATFNFFVDADLDGFGSGVIAAVCALNAATPPSGYSLDGTDCDDANAAIHQQFQFYVDADGDSYGTGSLVNACAIDASTPPTGFSANNTDCDDALGAVNPGASEVLYNGVDDNCDGQLDEGHQLLSRVLPSQCGTTLAAISSVIGAVSFSQPITGYRFKVVNTTTQAEQIIDKSVPHFQLTSLATYDYATTYSISVQLQRAGVWLGYYGVSCLVSTPAILDPAGAAQVSPSQCGVTLPSISSLIATTSLNGVTGYRFRVTNLSNPLSANPVQVLDRSTNWFSLTMLAEYTYGTTYMIEVAVKTNGVFSGFGSPCQVASPVVPTIGQCGSVIATKGMLVSTTSLNRATSYRFEVTDMATFNSSTVDRTQNWFTFNAISTYTPGAQMAVRVAVMTAGVWSDFGDACFVTAPGAAKTGVKGEDVTGQEVTFRVVPYPNPYSETFSLDADLASDESVTVSVYDMLGKIVEVSTFDATETETRNFGSRLAAGVYSVVVRQGENAKTLRVIKR